MGFCSDLLLSLLVFGQLLFQKQAENYSTNFKLEEKDVIYIEVYYYEASEYAVLHFYYTKIKGSGTGWGARSFLTNEVLCQVDGASLS